LVENTEIYVMFVASEQHRCPQTKLFYLEHHWGHLASLKTTWNFLWNHTLLFLLYFVFLKHQHFKDFTATISMN